jgi:hypothetical protein
MGARAHRGWNETRGASIPFTQPRGLQPSTAAPSIPTPATAKRPASGGRPWGTAFLPHTLHPTSIAQGAAPKSPKAAPINASRSPLPPLVQMVFTTAGCCLGVCRALHVACRHCTLNTAVGRRRVTHSRRTRSGAASVLLQRWLCAVDCRASSGTRGGGGGAAPPDGARRRPGLHAGVALCCRSHCIPCLRHRTARRAHHARRR